MKVTVALMLPFISISNDKKYKSSRYNTFSGEVTSIDCDGSSLHDYVIVGKSKFIVNYNMCKSLNVGSNVELIYNKRLKIVKIIYK